MQSNDSRRLQQLQLKVVLHCDPAEDETLRADWSGPPPRAGGIQPSCWEWGLGSLWLHLGVDGVDNRERAAPSCSQFICFQVRLLKALSLGNLVLGLCFHSTANPRNCV